VQVVGPYLQKQDAVRIVSKWSGYWWCKFILHCQTTRITYKEREGFSSFEAVTLNRFFFVREPLVGQGLLIAEASRSHSLRHTTRGRTSLDEWSVRRRDLYLTTLCTHNRQTSMPTGGNRTHSFKKRTTADSRLRPRGHRIWLNFVVFYLNIYCFSLRKHGSVSITENNRSMLLRKTITFIVSFETHKYTPFMKCWVLEC